MRLFTSESVTPGHPDKICDQISDAILDAYLAQDPRAHVAVEVMASARGVTLAGEVSSSAGVNREEVALGVLRRVGGLGAYIDGLEYLRDDVVAQSPEIAAGVGSSLESRDVVGPASHDVDVLDLQGAGDQGLMFGYAVNETPDLMPLPISIAHALSRRLYELAGEDDFTVLGSDGKTQVTVAYDGDRPVSIESVLVSTQHDARVAPASLRRIVTAEVLEPVLEQFGHQMRHGTLLVNPSGSFVFGGPAADAGLTGRKIIVDTYGGASRHGGGAFSGKDPSKVDRSGAYAMRWVAKHVVAAGLASRCEVQVAYAIGSAHPVGLYVETFGTGVISDERIAAAVRAVFDLRPAAIIRDLELLRPIYASTAAFGHFGPAPDSQRPWETISLSRLAALQMSASAEELQVRFEATSSPGFDVA